LGSPVIQPLAIAISLLKLRMVKPMQNTVDLTTNVQDGEKGGESFLGILQTITENISLLVGGPLLVGSLVLGASFLISPSFTASTTFLPPQQQQSAAASMLQSLGALGGLAGAAAGIKNPSDQYISFLQSRVLQDKLIERFQLKERYETPFEQFAREKLKKNTRISSGAKDGLITIDVDDKDPAFAAQLANAHVEELGYLLGRLAVTEAQQRRLFFEKRLTETKNKLIQAESALRASGVNVSAIKSNPQAAITEVAQISAQISAQEVKVASMRGYLTEDAPEFKRAIAGLSALRSQLEKVETSSTSAEGGADYIARYREFKYFETLFELFSKQYEIARIDESREGAVIQVLDVAQPPERKSGPKRALLTVAATILTAFTLLLFVFIRKALRNAAQDQLTAIRLKNIRRNLGFKS